MHAFCLQSLLYLYFVIKFSQPSLPREITVGCLVGSYVVTACADGRSVHHCLADALLYRCGQVTNVYSPCGLIVLAAVAELSYWQSVLHIGLNRTAF